MAGRRHDLDAAIEDICDQYDAGDTIAEIAARYHCSDQAIHARLLECGVQIRARGVRPSVTVWIPATPRAAR
jgi:hypothetical protein